MVAVTSSKAALIPLVSFHLLIGTRAQRNTDSASLMASVPGLFPITLPSCLVLSELYLFSCLRAFAHIVTSIWTTFSLLTCDLVFTPLLLGLLTHQLHILPALSVSHSH